MSLTILYPRPLALYETVVLDVNVFRSTLESFHRTFNTRLRYPSIGGIVLDFYKLFVEVTKHGGSVEVFLSNKWKEVAAVFDFPPGVKNNPHLKIRDHYMEFVYHYEQVYFLNALGYTFTPGKYPPGRVPPFITFGAGENPPATDACSLISLD